MWQIMSACKAIKMSCGHWSYLWNKADLTIFSFFFVKIISTAIFIDLSEVSSWNFISVLTKWTTFNAWCLTWVNVKKQFYAYIVNSSFTVLITVFTLLHSLVFISNLPFCFVSSHNKSFGSVQIFFFIIIFKIIKNVFSVSEKY